MSRRAGCTGEGCGSRAAQEGRKQQLRYSGPPTLRDTVELTAWRAPWTGRERGSENSNR